MADQDTTSVITGRTSRSETWASSGPSSIKTCFINWIEPESSTMKDGGMRLVSPLTSISLCSMSLHIDYRPRRMLLVRSLALAMFTDFTQTQSVLLPKLFFVDSTQPDNTFVRTLKPTSYFEDIAYIQCAPFILHLLTQQSTDSWCVGDKQWLVDELSDKAWDRLQLHLSGGSYQHRPGWMVFVRCTGISLSKIKASDWSTTSRIL